MRPSLRWRLAACALLVGTIAAGCTTGTADDPTSAVTSGTASPSVIDTSPASPASSVPASPSPSVIDVSTPPTSPTTLDPEAQEIADRAAVEAQWAKYWDTYINIVRTSPAERDLAANDVAVDPAASNLVKSAEYFESLGRDNYGSVTHRNSWLQPINGASSAVLSDCQDQSQFGSLDTASGKKLTVGVERDNISAKFTKGSDGIWRVEEVFYLVDSPC
jgi:hypothetical protein